MSANIVPPLSEGTSFACNMASSGSAFSNVESVCHAVARLTPYQSISPVSSMLVSQETSGQSMGRYIVIPVLLERPAERLIALLVKGRVDRPGADRIHPNAVRGVIRRHPACQSGDRRLGGIVLRRLADARHGPYRGDVDDAAEGRLPEERNRRFRTKRVPLEIHAEDLVPALDAGFFHRVIQPDPVVVDED